MSRKMKVLAGSKPHAMMSWEGFFVPFGWGSCLIVPVVDGMHHLLAHSFPLDRMHFTWEDPCNDFPTVNRAVETAMTKKKKNETIRNRLRKTLFQQILCAIPKHLWHSPMQGV